MLKYGVFERENLNLIIEYMRDTILVKITFLYHIESHSGYCSGAEAEETSDNKKTIIYELMPDTIQYDEDNDINVDSLKYLRMYAKCVPESQDIVNVIVITYRNMLHVLQKMTY